MKKFTNHSEKRHKRHSYGFDPQISGGIGLFVLTFSEGTARKGCLRRDMGAKWPWTKVRQPNHNKYIMSVPTSGPEAAFYMQIHPKLLFFKNNGISYKILYVKLPVDKGCFSA